MKLVFFSRPHFSIYGIFIQKKTHEVSTQGPLTLSRLALFQACYYFIEINFTLIGASVHCVILISQFLENDMFSIKTDSCMQFRSSEGLEKRLTFKISQQRIFTFSPVIEYPLTQPSENFILQFIFHFKIVVYLAKEPIGRKDSYKSNVLVPITLNYITEPAVYER